MICPHCNYAERVPLNNIEVYGERGPFYILPFPLVQESDRGFPMTRNIYGCPNCNKVFMGN